MKKRGRALALLLAAVLTVSSVPGTVMAADGVKPQDGTTKEQPFWSGTGGSLQRLSILPWQRTEKRCT